MAGPPRGQPRYPPAPEKAATASTEYDRRFSPNETPITLPCAYSCSPARLSAPPSRPLAGTGSRGGHLPGPSACLPSRLLLAPAESPNRPLVTLRPFPRRPRPDLPQPLPEFPAGPPPAAPGDLIAKGQLFLRA
jgi:hypothetical protein